MAIQVHISPAEALYVRDPQVTDLGREILAAGIAMLDELGLEQLTFRKLAAEVGCTEASIYRYFSSKQQLLIYLVSWYWDWVHYLIQRAAAGAGDAVEKLRAGVRALTQPMVANPSVPYIDERLLHRVVLTEGTKAYHSKRTDQHNKAGVFLPYKELVGTLAGLIADVNPDFAYPRTLASSLFEMAHNHIYFAEHLPRLTDVSDGAPTAPQLEDMLALWVDRLLLLETPTAAEPQPLTDR